ncbi:hypothetical protein BSR03_17185 [Serratia proteamaculans]|uniref:hypothetical protein n=1 Tax=Serratia proteamaculans TaxID=28151 RepID=UPI00101FB626|nr:hypothetical protein [Serratia proteamaculans]RYM60177.1 hypothetical protein BSR03_17185 [Serratia proteamaculans]
MTTQLEQQRQLQIAQERARAIQPVTVTPNQGSVVPAVYQRNYVQEEMDKYPQITPPTEENIKKNMWIASGMVGLMAALATGNAAGGIAAGMVAAVGVHDHGFDLRQRGQYIRRLQEDGYSYPAILAWYKTGDNKELDKEREYMLQKDKFKEEKDEFTQTEEDKRLDREQQARLERDRLDNQMNIARMHEAGANARAVMQADATREAQSKSGLTQMNMQHRQALMNAAKMDADQFKAMTKSQAAADKAVADAKLGTPIALQQMLLMGQLIDAPNASVKLTQLHHMSEGAAHGLVDKALQTANNLATGKPVTDEQMQELLQVIAAGHQAQTDTYYKQVGRQASRYKDDLDKAKYAVEQFPADAGAKAQLKLKSQDYDDFSIAAGLNPQELDYAVRLYKASPKVMEENHDAQTFGSGSAVGSSTGSSSVTYKEPE